ncbi:MAG: glycosyl transferase group 1 [Candidatus Magasanikbacteria bacterium]|nr:glycosyl transferase group 1 [Candidatus Magasanikbacteria bacterium]
MRIGFLTLEYPPEQIGGLGNSLASTIAQFSFDEAVVLLNVTDRRQRGELKDASGRRVIKERLMRKFLWPTWMPTLKAVRRFVKKEKIDFLHVSHLLPLGYAALWAKWWRRTPFIISLHGLDVKSAAAHFWKRQMARMILRRAHLITVNSEATKKNLLSLFNARDRVKIGTRVIVVYPCAHLTPARFPVSESAMNDLRSRYAVERKWILLSIGRMIKRKGFDAVIAALPVILKKYHDLVYVLVGDGPEINALGRQVVELGLQNSVRFTGPLSDLETAEWLSVANVFIMPSRESKEDVEGFGIVFLEAAAFGKPAIGGAGGGVGEAIIEGETGIIVDPEKTEEIVRATSRLKDDATLALTLGERARLRNQKDFQPEIQVQKLKSRLTELPTRKA